MSSLSILGFVQPLTCWCVDGASSGVFTEPLAFSSAVIFFLFHVPHYHFSAPVSFHSLYVTYAFVFSCTRPNIQFDIQAKPPLH